jgi:hypothetical protein
MPHKKKAVNMKNKTGRMFLASSYIAFQALRVIADVTEPDMSDARTKSGRRTPVYVTNYVRIPQFCGQAEVADVQWEPGHVYRLYVQSGTGPWRYYGVLRPGTNTQGRIWFPAASTRQMAWQLVDHTPGFPKTAVVKIPPDCVSKPEWVVLGVGNIRPARN